MKSNFLVTVLLLLSINMFSQATYYPLVKGSGVGESTITDLNYSHHTNYLMRILNLTVKWKLSTLFGEPVVDGVFKWKAASDTPDDYLDYRDYVLLECSPVTSFGYSVYIKLTPTVPKSGEGYGFNTPGSPSWANIFCTRKGEDMTREVPAFNAATAKEIWKGGFRITGVVLLREGGKDGFLKPQSNSSDDFWNTPENTTTTQQQTQEIKQKEAVERQKQLKEQARAKYNALKNPYSWNVTNNDTLFDAGVQLLKNLNPYFNNGTITLSSVNKGKVTGTANNISTNLPLTEGWNTLRIALKGTNYNLRDSVRVYYKKSSRKVLLFDDFNDDINNGQNWKIIKNGINCQVSQSNSCLTLTVEYINNGSYQNTFNSCIELISKTLNIQPEKKLIFEIRYKVNSENRDYIEYDGETKIMRGNDYKFYFNFSPEKKYNYEKNCIRHQFSPISKDYEHGNFDLDVESYSWGTHNFDGWFKIRDNIINGEWLNEKIIFNPNEKKISVFINNNFIDEGNPSPIDMNVLQFVFRASTLNYESYVIDYIKIYQE